MTVQMLKAFGVRKTIRLSKCHHRIHKCLLWTTPTSDKIRILPFKKHIRVERVPLTEFVESLTNF